MPEKLTCEFQIKAGTKWQQDCGDPAGTYEVTSMITIEMNLCDAHRNKLIADYGWTVEKIKDKEATCRLNQNS